MKIANIFDGSICDNTHVKQYPYFDVLKVCIVYHGPQLLPQHY